MNRNPFEFSMRAAPVVQSRSDTTLTTILCSTSFSEEMMNESVVSALTLEEDLLCISERSLFRSTLISIDERRWSSDPTIIECTKSEDSHRHDRFSNCSEHGDTAMCPIPKRRGSIVEISSPLSNKESTRDLGFYREFNKNSDLTSTCGSEPTFADASRASLDLFEVFGKDRTCRRNGHGGSLRLVRH